MSILSLRIPGQDIRMMPGAYSDLNKAIIELIFSNDGTPVCEKRL
jgi:hypothetical protein